MLVKSKLRGKKLFHIFVQMGDAGEDDILCRASKT